MKILGLFLAMCAGCFGQAPEGWEKVAPIEGLALEIWESQDQSSRVGIKNFAAIPTLDEILMLSGKKTVLPGLKKVVVLEAPNLGLRFEMEHKSAVFKDQWIIHEHEGKWRFLAVVVLDGEGFSLEQWRGKAADGDFERVWRGKLGEIAKQFNEIIANPPVVAKEVKEAPEHEILVAVLANGVFSYEGKEISENQLEKVFKEKVEKPGGEKSVLRIVADKEVDFTFTRKVIRLGAKSGIEWVAYTTKQEADEKE